MMSAISTAQRLKPLKLLCVKLLSRAQPLKPLYEQPARGADADRQCKVPGIVLYALPLKKDYFVTQPYFPRKYDTFLLNHACSVLFSVIIRFAGGDGVGYQVPPSEGCKHQRSE